PVGSEPLAQLLGPDGYSRKVLLNLDKVPHIDSVGVGWLVRCHKHCQDAGGRLVLFAPRDAVRQVFDLLNLASLLHIAEPDAASRGPGDLDPKFRAALRWVLARENRSAYGRAVAAADFRRAGGAPAQLPRALDPDGGWNDAERAAFAFARKMAFTAHTVADEE